MNEIRSWHHVSPCPLSDVEMVLLVSSIHTKLLVHPCEFVPLLILQVNSQFHVLSSGQAVYVSQTVPEFRVKVTKSFFIIFPSSIEVDCPIWNSTLDHYPPSPIFLHITSNLSFSRVPKGVDSTANISDLVFPRLYRREWNVLNLHESKKHLLN